jgi:uncharacterized protein YcbK (DUF882 family)
MIVARRRALMLGLATSAIGLSSLRADAAISSPAGFRGAMDAAAASKSTRFADTEASSTARRAYLHNLHTGDTLDAVYFADGRYVPGALAAAMRVLRDWRDGEEHLMDPQLFDLLHHLRIRTEASAPFQIISGYRSPATNAMMHAESHEVAAKSQHMFGRALDIRIQGVDLARLHQAALSLRAGGVGYYPQSDFVHVDVGPLRQWSGT